jgi:hydroxymethylpyrimidine/phosphomethylpyrimidine kinase
MTADPPPVVLTIAGSDSSCGAGAQADIKSIAAMGGYGLNALTSVVAESPGKVSMIRLLDPEIIADQIRVLFDAFPIRAVKTGMLGGVEQVRAVVAAVKKHASSGIPLVIDPVMVATGGGKLLEDEAVSCMRESLLPLAALITPNMDEAAVLTGRTLESSDDMQSAACEMAKAFGTAILLKGGHLKDAAADVLCEKDENECQWFESPRIEGVRTHGTGCSLSAAIATGLARGLGLRDAVASAKVFVTRAIADHFAWNGLHALNHLARRP